MIGGNFIKINVEDKKIRSLIKQIKELCEVYIDFVESYNECAATDRIVENIVDKSKEIEKNHNKMFNKNKTNDYER